MSKKETETISTQTSIAAISEVKKIKKSKEVLCSVCRRQSMCQWCLNDQELTVPQEEIKILRTQDILLAYKPCYIVTKVTEKDKHLQLPCLSQIKLKPPTQPSLKEDSVGESRHTICVFLQSDKKVKPQGINITKYFAQNVYLYLSIFIQVLFFSESFNEWSYVTDATMMKSYSIKGKEL